ncbi:MAG: PASTA domain-containing protein [Cyanobacteria bacterium J06600_6]
MNKTSSLATLSFIAIGIVGALFPSLAQAREIDCVNYWVNTETRLAQCFDSQLDLIAVPSNYFNNTTATTNNSPTSVRRRATDRQEMVMPDLIGLEIDAAEDYLLGLGVTIGSEEVYAQNNKVAGEITQQSPPPGTELTKGQAVFLEYMGAAVNLQQML